MKHYFLGIFLVFLSPAAQASSDANQKLFRAIAEAKPATFEEALNEQADLNGTNDKGIPAISAAILAKQKVMVNMLLERGADPNIPYKEYLGATPLMLAVQTKAINIAERLIDHGADVNIHDAAGDPAINWAAFYGYEDFVDLFLKHNAEMKFTGHGSPLDIAMRRGHQTLVQKLANYTNIPSADPAVRQVSTSIIRSDLPGLTRLLANGADPNALDDTARPVLAMAARTGFAKGVKLLLKSGANIDQVDPIGFTPLMEAAREGHDEVVDLLVQEGADVNHKSYANSLQLSPLHMAAASGNLRSLDLLVAAGANLNAVGSKNDSALFWSLSEGKPEAALKLINLGADPYIQSDYGMSAADIILQGNNETLKSALPTAKAIGP